MMIFLVLIVLVILFFTRPKEKDGGGNYMSENERINLRLQSLEQSQIETNKRLGRMESNRGEDRDEKRSSRT